MASEKRYVRLQGIIRGDGGIEAECTVRALEVRMPGGGPAAYAQYMVERVSKQLPDGLYDLNVNAETHKVRHQGDHWLDASPV